jgi:HlyD family secretion protein
MHWKVLSLLLLAGLLAGGYFVILERRAPAVPLERLIEPRRGDIASGVIAVGRVEPRTRVEVKSKANGIVQKFHVDVNDPVAAGQVIAELDQEILAARVAEAEAKLKQALAALDLARADVRRIEVERTDPELAFAERNWERVQQLHQGGLASEDEYDLAHERHEKAQYRMRTLDAQVEISQAAIDAALGRVNEVQAVADLARQELQEATIRSPIDGVVLYRYLEEGDAVSSIRVAGGNATILMTLGDLSELYVDGQIDEVDVGKITSEQQIRPDLVARITVESYRGKPFFGRVSRITPLGLEDQNGIVTYEVRIVLDNPQKLLLANMTANSLIVLEEKKDVLLLSQGALITDGKARFATVYDPRTGRAHRQQVTVGLSDGSEVEIAGGLEPGQKVLVP